MSEVLRKKIMLATGVPQNVLRMASLWRQFRTAFGDWTLANFGIECIPVFDIRRVISGKAALDVLKSEVSYKFPTDRVSGLAAIVLDTACVYRYAASRLNETASGLQGASPLLLKLVCEELAVGLRRGLSTGFGLTSPGPWQSPTESVKAVAGEFAATTRYLHVGARIPIQPEALHVSLIFLLDDIQLFARASGAAEADRAAESRLHTPDSLRASVRKASISIEVVLDQLTMSVGDCSRLRVGQVLSLPSAALQRLSIAAETITGSMTIGQGEMGVWKQNRAIKLASAINPGFVRNIAEL